MESTIESAYHIELSMSIGAVIDNEAVILVAAIEAIECFPCGG